MPNYGRHDNLNSTHLKHCKFKIPTRKLGKIEPWPLGILEAILRSSNALQVATNNIEGTLSPTHHKSPTKGIKPHLWNLTHCKLPIVNIEAPPTMNKEPKVAH